MFEVPAGGRRYRALELLVKQKRLAKTAARPLRGAGSERGHFAEEDSLAENDAARRPPSARSVPRLQDAQATRAWTRRTSPRASSSRRRS